MGKKLDAYRKQEIADWSKALDEGVNLVENRPLADLIWKRLGWKRTPGKQKRKPWMGTLPPVNEMIRAEYTDDRYTLYFKGDGEFSMRTWNGIKHSELPEEYLEAARRLSTRQKKST